MSLNDGRGEHVGDEAGVGVDVGDDPVEGAGGVREVPGCGDGLGCGGGGRGGGEGEAGEEGPDCGRGGGLDGFGGYAGARTQRSTGGERAEEHGCMYLGGGRRRLSRYRILNPPPFWGCLTTASPIPGRLIWIILITRKYLNLQRLSVPCVARLPRVWRGRWMWITVAGQGLWAAQSGQAGSFPANATI